MFCKNCGKNLGEVQNDLCIECEATLNTRTIENENVEVIKEVGKNNSSNNNSNSNTNNNNNINNVGQAKSKIAAGLLAIFLGALGIHNFYLGYTGKAIGQLLLTVLSCGALSFISGIWGLIEGILIFTGEIATDAKGVGLRD